MSDRLELRHVERVLKACLEAKAPDDVLALAGGLAVVATVIKQRDAAERALDLLKTGAIVFSGGFWAVRGDTRVFSNWPQALHAFDYGGEREQE